MRPIRLAGLALASLAMLAAALIAGARSGHNPARPAPMPAVAICAFDGGGMAVAGSVTRTDNGRLWQCTDDGYLVPWAGHLPNDRNN